MFDDFISNDERKMFRLIGPIADDETFLYCCADRQQLAIDLVDGGFVGVEFTEMQRRYEDTFNGQSSFPGGDILFLVEDFTSDE